MFDFLEQPRRYLKVRSWRLIRYSNCALGVLRHWPHPCLVLAQGTTMVYWGIPGEEDRRDLVAYLKVASAVGSGPVSSADKPLSQ